jgi:hypothetical protein
MSSHSSRPPELRRLWKPAAGIGVAVWLEEILAFGQEIIAVIFLPLSAGVIYLLNAFLFRSRMPTREDLKPTNDRRIME